MVAPSVDRVSAPPPKAAAPERPSLALIGAVVGESDAIAVFLDQANQKIVRLHQGESHAGWELSSVQPREVTFRKAGRTEVLALKRQDGSAGVADAPAGAKGIRRQSQKLSIASCHEAVRSGAKFLNVCCLWQEGGIIDDPRGFWQCPSVLVLVLLGC